MFFALTFAIVSKVSVTINIITHNVMILVIEDT